jgi:hypothetical protein
MENLAGNIDYEFMLSFSYIYIVPQKKSHTMRMKSHNFKYGIFAIVVILLSGCSKSNTSGSLYTPVSSDATSTATLDELLQGRTLYINNCNACHALYSPDDYTSSQWKTIMGSMGPRTSMSSSQILLVTKYVTRGK